MMARFGGVLCAAVGPGLLSWFAAQPLMAARVVILVGGLVAGLALYFGLRTASKAMGYAVGGLDN